MSAADSVPAVEYRPVDGFPGYRVGDDGTVLGKHGRRLRPAKDTNGRPFVGLHVDGKRKLKGIHRIVLEAFAGPCPEGKECAHKNGKCDDNRLSNLEWKTHKDNMADRIPHGTHLEGEQITTSKITNSAAVKIADMLRDTGLSQVAIASACGATVAVVRTIAQGRGWRNANGGRPIKRPAGASHGESSPQSKLTESQVVQIRLQAADGKPYNYIADEFGITGPVVFLIARGKIWKHVGGPILACKRRRGRPPGACNRKS
jgi:hypothetical protein